MTALNEKPINHLIEEKWQKVEEIKELNIEPFGRSFEKKHYINYLLSFDETSTKIFKTAGRIMSYRRMGKNIFAHIEDQTGKIQIYARSDQIGIERYEILKKMGVGDHIGVEGTLFKTKTDELTLRIESFKLLSKNIRPLPEKFHGLTDIEIRYRQRYLDLIMNKEVKETFLTRFKVIKLIRNYMENKGFLETETPMLHPIIGGASAKPFVTHHNTLDMELYLRIAPELYLKRLLVGGFDKVFEINRCFRNEGISTQHNPEFTMMECYQAYSDMDGMLNLTEDLINYIVKELFGKEEIEYQGKKINFAKPWKKMTMSEAVKNQTGIDFKSMNHSEIIQEAKSLGIELEENMSKFSILNLIFEEKVEETLINPTFITEYPKEISPLAKNLKDEKDWVDRFEAFIFGREVANAFSELNDPREQKKRFEDQVKKRESGDEEAQMMDLDYINALEYGLPPAGGLGIGIDRLVMFFTNSFSIRDVILFPHMRNKGHNS